MRSRHPFGSGSSSRQRRGHLSEPQAVQAEAQESARRAKERRVDSDADHEQTHVEGVEHVSSSGRRDYAPVGHSPETGVWPTAKRVFHEFQENSLTDQAASLTYYGLLALFPALIALTGLVGIVGDPQATTKTLTDIVSELAPGSAAQTFRDTIASITADRGTAGVMVVVGIATALWSASGYVGAFMRASNKICETPEGRAWWKLRPLQLLITFIVVVLITALLIATVLTGPVVDAVADPLGIGDQAVSVWKIAKWPVMALVVLLILGLLFYASPNVRIPGFRLITPGAILALALWLAASVAFAFYVANFGSYNKTYGALGGLISLLVWLWISNLAVLLGLQLNAELERNRELNAGIPDAAREIQLDARHKPGNRHTT